VTSILLHRLSVCLALKTAFNCSVAACMYRIVLQHPFCFIAFLSVSLEGCLQLQCGCTFVLRCRATPLQLSCWPVFRTCICPGSSCAC
jgi:hypothetical protein